MIRNNALLKQFKNEVFMHLFLYDTGVNRWNISPSPHFGQWSNGKTTALSGGVRFLGPYSDGEERPCREFSFRPFESGMARVSFDLYEVD